MDEPITVDMETEAIASRPYYPPKPIGLAVRWPGGKKEYWAFGHRDGNNNCSMAKAAAVLRDIHSRPEAKLYHNGAFDIDVNEVHLKARQPAYVEDTLFLAFLKNPHEPTIGLKPLAEKYLGEPPQERDVLHEWILNNVKVNGRKMPKKYKAWGAHICEAPASIVGPYAIGDVERTYQLWKKFRPEIVQRGMYDAYQREIKLIPVTREMERSGIRVDVLGIKKALHVFEQLDSTLIKAIHRKLKINRFETYQLSEWEGDEKRKPKPFNVNSGAMLAAAMDYAGKFSHIVKTKTGRMSTKVSVLHETCNDRELLDLLAVHSVVDKYVTGFLRPWLEQSELTGGRVLPKFNQVRARSGDGGGGTRTGRYSSSDPNLQTVTANVDESKNKTVLQLLQKWLLEYYRYEFIGLRDFFLPDKGSVLIATDYNQQELRLLAHFEQGLLAAAYKANPKLDVHTYIQQLIKSITGVEYPRKAVKILVFGVVYGMGAAKLALAIDEPLRVAQDIRAGLFKAVPGINQLMKQLRVLADMDKPLRTWGGREYYCEPPVILKDTGKVITFQYKMLNQLIQPSAADVTKQGMLNVAKDIPNVRIAIQVHDELVCMAPDESYGPLIEQCMCAGEFNVPMLAESKYSRETWARAK